MMTRPVAMPTRHCNPPGRILDGGAQFDARPYCLHGVVLVRGRVAEMHQRGVAGAFADDAVQPRNRVGDALVVGADNIPPILEVDPIGKDRFPYQIADINVSCRRLSLVRVRRRAGLLVAGAAYKSPAWAHERAASCRM